MAAKSFFPENDELKMFWNVCLSRPSNKKGTTMSLHRLRTNWTRLKHRQRWPRGHPNLRQIPRKKLEINLNLKRPFTDTDTAQMILWLGSESLFPVTLMSFSWYVERLKFYLLEFKTFKGIALAIIQMLRPDQAMVSDAMGPFIVSFIMTFQDFDQHITMM